MVVSSLREVLLHKLSWQKIHSSGQAVWWIFLSLVHGFLFPQQVVDWILGPGEKLLASQSDIGDSYETAEVLRKRHEELEIKCTVSLKTLTENSLMVGIFIHYLSSHSVDMKWKTWYMKLLSRPKCYILKTDCKSDSAMMNFHVSWCLNLRSS